MLLNVNPELHYKEQEQSQMEGGHDSEWANPRTDGDAEEEYKSATVSLVPSHLRVLHTLSLIQVNHSTHGCSREVLTLQTVMFSYTKVN